MSDLAVLSMPAKGSKKESSERPQTTLRAYSDTAKKIAELAKLRGMTIHDMLDDMFLELIEHELIEAATQRLAELQKGQSASGKRPRSEGTGEPGRPASGKRP